MKISWQKTVRRCDYLLNITQSLYIYSEYSLDQAQAECRYHSVRNEIYSVVIYHAIIPRRISPLNIYTLKIPVFKSPNVPSTASIVIN